MDTMLSVNHIKKSFGDNLVLNDVSLSVNKGDVLAVIGPSGSGKSTLLRCINQLETVDSGEIIICGDTLVKNTAAEKAQYCDKETQRKIRLHIGLVFQNFNLFPHYTVLRNITQAPVKVLGQSVPQAEENARALLSKMGLSDKESAYPYELSGGQQQRVSIARALALNPDILFFDEPTSALDPELTGEILKVMRDLAAEHMTMVVVTHEMKFARNVADHVLFMDNGVVIESGSAEQVFDASSNERTRQFLARYYED